MPEGVALARDLVGPAMEAAIARLTPDVRAVAAYHLGFADAAGNPAGALLDSPGPLTEEDLDRAAGLVVAAGGRDWAESEADAQLAAANASLSGIDLPAGVRAELTAIAEFITARTWLRTVPCLLTTRCLRTTPRPSTSRPWT
jgi:hypothetical protein